MSENVDREASERYVARMGFLVADSERRAMMAEVRLEAAYRRIQELEGILQHPEPTEGPEPPEAHSDGE